MRAGVAGIKRRHTDLFADVSFERLLQLHSDILEAMHLRMLDGEVTRDEARVLRTQELFAVFGHRLTVAEAEDLYVEYRADYDDAADVVPGTFELLDELEARGVRMGIVTNNLVAEQLEKLEQLKLSHYFEMLAISEEVGVAKPDPAIFDVALSRMELGAADVVMIGNSLESDVAGAIAAGIDVVWLDRLNEGAAAAPPEVKAVIPTDLSDTHMVLEALLERR